VDISAVALSVVAAAATLTPLILGLLNYFKDKKKEAEQPAIPSPAATLGETVDFESVAVQSLNAQIKMLDATVVELRERNIELKKQRDANASMLIANGLSLPIV
jgi:TolA-binding protein